MNNFILIREYRPEDAPFVNDVVRNAYLSIVPSSWYNSLLKEITFQLIVIFAAIMFIFVGVPLLYCFAAIPLVLFLMYVIIYGTFLMKGTELTYGKKPLQCWVAEACEPFLFMQNPGNVSYRIVTKPRLCDEEIDVGNCRRKVIGTVAVSKHLNFESAAWLFRLAVEKRYQRKGVGRALIQTTQNWCRSKKYESLELAMSECQESARQLFFNTGFQVKQMYHKQMIGSALTLLMFQLRCDLKPDF